MAQVRPDVRRDLAPGSETLGSLVLETIRAVISCELRAKMRLGHTRSQVFTVAVQGHEYAKYNLIII